MMILEVLGSLSQYMCNIAYITKKSDDQQCDPFSSLLLNGKNGRSDPMSTKYIFRYKLLAIFFFINFLFKVMQMDQNSSPISSRKKKKVKL
jgi:hypothetical protein